jgi:hypothetical protein
MLITRTSVFGVTRSMELPVTPEQITRWQDGELAQNVFTQLNNEQREFLISGNTTEDWERLFAENADTDV